MTPEEINYVREWARNGNNRRTASEIPHGVIMAQAASAFASPHLTPFNYLLTDAGLAIAALADALEQACATAELPGPNYRDEFKPHRDALETMRKNKRGLLG